MFFFSSAMVARTWSEISMALEPGDWKIGMATADLLSSSERRPYSRGADLDARDVLQPRHHAVGVVLDDDVAELLGVGQAALRVDRQLQLDARCRRAGRR